MSSDQQQSKRNRKRNTKNNNTAPRRQSQDQSQRHKKSGGGGGGGGGLIYYYSYASIFVAVGATFISLYSDLFSLSLSSLHGGSSFTASSKSISTSTSKSTSTSTSTSTSNPSTRFALVSLKEDEVILPDETQQWNSSDPVLRQTFDFLSNYVCNTSTNTNSSSSSSSSSTPSYCHPLLYPAPQRRTHYVAKTKSSSSSTSKSESKSKTTTSMKQGDIVMILPRHLLIWDLDAMRNPEFVQKELFAARHGQTDNALDSGAFLASFLLYKQKLLQGTWQWDNDNGNDNNNDNNNDHGEKHSNTDTDNENARLIQYLNILPKSHSKMITNHPVLWSEQTLNKLFGKNKFTVTFQLVQAYKDMIQSEYQAFCHVSSTFEQNINETEYTAMRINVMSRSFGPGPPGKDEELSISSTTTTTTTTTNTLSLEEELNFYHDSTGVNLTKGCRAMSPILDMWDHHRKPNVKWTYSRADRAFIITVFVDQNENENKNEIPPFHDIMVSYGMYTDSHLFAKFGFVNGDGSGHTELSIAVMHRLLDVGLGQQYSYMKRNVLPLSSDGENQRKNLLQYLVSDDGYRDCIQKETNPEAYELKLLKYRLLQVIANKRERWTVKFQPRNEDSKPAANSFLPIQDHPPRFDPQNVKFDGSAIIATCRLLALTNTDYEGKALEVLRNVFTSGTADSFQVDRQTDELEYRALMWLARLTNISLKKYPSTVREDMERLVASSLDIPFRSKEWNVLQVRLGEMQSLESLRSIASSGTRHMMERIKRRKKNVDVPEMYIRQKVCKFEYTAKLLEDDKK